jgi:6-phosphofructokinase 2
MKTILTVTINPAIDVSAFAQNIFPNHKLRCSEARHDPGGGGVNVSRAIKKLGGESIAVMCCGGPTGLALRGLLDAAEVSYRAIPIRGWTRQNFTIIETATEQQFRFVMPGPTLSDEEWNHVWEALHELIPSADFVVASGSLPPDSPEDFYARLARTVRDAGKKLILDTSGPPLVEAVREGVFIVKPSLRELKEFATTRTELEPDQEMAAMALVNAGHCEAAIISLGAGGVLFASASGCERIQAPSVTVRSRTGAGDSMVAGIVLSLARGDGLRDAVRFGIAAGTAAVMNPGTELCHYADTAKLFAQMSKISGA